MPGGLGRSIPRQPIAKSLGGCYWMLVLFCLAFNSLIQTKLTPRLLQPQSQSESLRRRAKTPQSRYSWAGGHQERTPEYPSKRVCVRRSVVHHIKTQGNNIRQAPPCSLHRMSYILKGLFRLFDQVIATDQPLFRIPRRLAGDIDRFPAVCGNHLRKPVWHARESVSGLICSLGITEQKPSAMQYRAGSRFFKAALSMAQGFFKVVALSQQPTTGVSRWAKLPLRSSRGWEAPPTAGLYQRLAQGSDSDFGGTLIDDRILQFHIVAKRKLLTLSTAPTFSRLEGRL